MAQKQNFIFHTKDMNTKPAYLSLEGVFFSDADEYNSIDLNDGRLHELFNAETKSERDMKSAIFFGMPFKKIVKLYSIWKRYNMLMSPSTIFKRMHFDGNTLHNVDSYEDTFIMSLTIECMQEYSAFEFAFEFNELDKTYLTNIEFANINITPFHPVYPMAEFTIKIHSSEVKKEIFKSILNKIREQQTYKI